MRLIFFLLLLPFVSFGRKFYFSSSTGSDSRTLAQAQNPATPWQTFASTGFIFWPTYPVNPSIDNYTGYRTFQYGGDNIVGNPDTLLDIRNNIIWITTGTQAKYSSRTKIFYRNNLYHTVGGYLFPSAVGAALGVGELIDTTTQFLTDTSSIYPQNWNYYPSSNSVLIDAGQFIKAFFDYVGNPVGNPPDIGAYEFIPPAVPTGTLRVRKRFQSL